VTDQPMQLFPNPEEIAPPDRCPMCGNKVIRLHFLAAECVECPYFWRRSAQIASNEPWPGEPL